MSDKRETKVWFITGSSRGFGRLWTEAALQRGDKVAATARNVASIADLKQKFGDNVLTLALDVTKPEEVTHAVNTAHAHFGRIDVLINNAGYSLVGTIEEATINEVKQMYDTNVFGTVSVIQAVLPLMRQQGGGHILGVSSNLGHLAYPVIGYYCSTKWAFEAIHESLAAEIKDFGIKVTIIEPGAYATEFGSEQSLRFTQNMAVYADFKNNFMGAIRNFERGNPVATPNAIFKVVDAEHAPLRLLLGSNNMASLKQTYAERMATWEAWQDVSIAAQG